MNRFLISFGIIIILVIVGSLIGGFFDIPGEYYLPFIGWGIALLIFYNILDDKNENIFLKKLKELKNS